MKLGDRLFGDMSRPEHAYVLGVAAAVGRIRGELLELRLRGDGEPLVGLCRAHTSSDEAHAFGLTGGHVRVVTSVGKVVSSFLGAIPGPRVTLHFPSMRDEMSWAFCRGLFDAAADIPAPTEEHLVVRLERPAEPLLTGLLDFLGVAPLRVGPRVVRWEGAAALDLLGLLYESAASEPRSSAEPSQLSSFGNLGDPVSRVPSRVDATTLARPKHVKRYRAWCHKVAHLAAREGFVEPLLVQRLLPEAVLPSKSRVSDSGYDLTVIREVKRFGAVILFGTGLAIEPPQGWYLDVVPRSSIIKTGYGIANSVGVIDRAYRGEIMIPLIKQDLAQPDLNLPARIGQLIPRPIMHFPIQEAADLSRTHRGSGGFGSSG